MPNHQHHAIGRNLGAVMRWGSSWFSHIARAPKLLFLVAGSVVIIAVAGAVILIGLVSGPSDTWLPSGPATFTDQLAVAPRGHRLVAAGAGLWISTPDRTQWRQVGPFNSIDTVFDVTLPTSGPNAVYVGAANGVWSAPFLDGPYEKLNIPAEYVRRVVVNPRNPMQLWVSSAEGYWRSDDGGHHWESANEGVTDPRYTWALTWYHGHLFGSDDVHVYVFDAEHWAPVSNQYQVVSLESVRGQLWATSMGDGIWLRSETGAWSPSNDGLNVRSATGRVSTVSAFSMSPYCGLDGHPGPGTAGAHIVTLDGSRKGVIYAGTMLDGIDRSSDNGKSWHSFAPQLAHLGVVWQVLHLGNQVMVATDTGIYARTA